MRLKELLDGVQRELSQMREQLRVISDRETVREWYTTEQFGKLVGRSEFTCREWCRLGRVRAEKQRSGRGAFFAWVVPHIELLRFQREGLLPLPRRNKASDGG